MSFALARKHLLLLCCGLFAMRCSFLGMFHRILCYCWTRNQNHIWFMVLYSLYMLQGRFLFVDYTTTIYGNNTQVYLFLEDKCRWACSGACEFSFVGGAWLIIGSSCWILWHVLVCWFGAASEEWVGSWREWFKSVVFISNWFVNTWRDVTASEGEAWYIKCLATKTQPLYVWAL